MRAFTPFSRLARRSRQSRCILAHRLLYDRCGTLLAVRAPDRSTAATAADPVVLDSERLITHRTRIQKETKSSEYLSARLVVEVFSLPTRRREFGASADVGDQLTG